VAIPCWGLMRADVTEWDEGPLQDTRVIVGYRVRYLRQAPDGAVLDDDVPR